MHNPLCSVVLGGGDVVYGHICKPYRGHGVHVEINETNVVSFNGVERRYRATWHLYKEGNFFHEHWIASFAETRDFVCPEEARGYAERRAHTFVDCAFTMIRS